MRKFFTLLLLFGGLNGLSRAQNVGIGQPNPVQKLDVNGNSRINNTFVGDVGHGATWAGWANYSQANTTGYSLLASSDGNYTLINKQNTGTGYIGFRMSNSDVAVINGAGNMGVGTTAPAANARLQVVGGAIMPAVGNANTGGLYFPTDPGGGSGDEAFLRYYIQSGEDAKLMLGVNNDADDDLGFWQAGAERMTVYNGMVGIGTTTPGYILDVANKERVRMAGADMGNANTGQLELSNAGNGAAYISFHREGAYGAHFGLETDNWFSTRGWSAGGGYTSLRVGELAYGNSLQNTLTRDNAGLQGNAGARSGFYETSVPTNYYAGANSWQHLIEARHSNPGNNYAMQFAGSFFDQRLFFRKTNNNASQAWREVVLIPTQFYARNGSAEGSFRAQISNGTLQFEAYNEGGGLIWSDYNVSTGLAQANIAFMITNDDTGNCGTAKVSMNISMGTIVNNGGWTSRGTDMGCSGSDGHNLMIFISAY